VIRKGNYLLEEKMNNSERTGGRHWLPQLIATAALVVAALLIAAQPAAAKDPVGDGKTTLKPTKKISKALAKGNVKVKPKGSASAGKNGLKFPVTGGKITPGEPDGKVQHQGSRLQLKKGKTKVTLRNPLINLTKAKLNVGVSGSSLKLFDLDYSKAKITRDGFATVYDKVKAKLTKASARVLKKGFGLKVKKGTVFGKAKVVADLSAVSLKAAGDTTLDPDPGAAAALEGAGISLAPIAPATAGPGGFEFPITGGKVNTSDLNGDIKHSGGIQFSMPAMHGSGPGVVVDLTDFTIQIDENPDLVASVGDSRVSILSLDLSGASIDIMGTNVTVSHVEASLTADAAAALNATFSTSLFTEGLVIGTATVAAQAN
jgi:hypothetical protein